LHTDCKALPPAAPTCTDNDTKTRDMPITDREPPAPATYTKVALVTDTDGRARFRESVVALDHGTPAARLSVPLAASALQLRQSPVGFRSDFHCTTTPQWVFVLAGRMEIGLRDGSSRVFAPGDHFHSADTVPVGAAFDPAVHGHWSRQVGDVPLVTAFVRD
jgi:hypothetical protein